jgi:hypothetical protein
MSEEPKDTPQPDPEPRPQEGGSPFAEPPLEELQKGLNPFERETRQDD